MSDLYTHDCLYCIVFLLFCTLPICIFVYCSFVVCVLSCCCHSVALWSFVTITNSSYVQTYLANKAHSDSDMTTDDKPLHMITVGKQALTMQDHKNGNSQKLLDLEDCDSSSLRTGKMWNTKAGLLIYIWVQYHKKLCHYQGFMSKYSF